MLLFKNVSIYTWQNIGKQYKNNKVKTIAITWNYKFDLPDSSYYVSNVQDYIETSLKIMEH